MFGRFKRPDAFDQQKRAIFIDALSSILQIQMACVASPLVEAPDGTINKRALDYIYGFIDAALQTIGQNMSDATVGIPITFHILRRLFPGPEERYSSFLAREMGHDETVTAAAMTGGQQYVDYSNGKLKATMGLARILSGG